MNNMVDLWIHLDEEWRTPRTPRARERVVSLAFNFPLPFRPGASCTQKITSIMNGGGGNGVLAALDIMGGPEETYGTMEDGRRRRGSDRCDSRFWVGGKSAARSTRGVKSARDAAVTNTRARFATNRTELRQGRDSS